MIQTGLRGGPVRGLGYSVDDRARDVDFDPPFVGEALDNPAPRRQAGYIFQPVNLLLTTLAVASVAMVERAPLVTPTPQVRAAVQVQAPPNLLLTTLGQTNTTVSLSGSAVTVSAGTLTPTSSLALSGQAVTASAGTITPNGVADPIRPQDFQRPIFRGRAQPTEVPNLLGTTLAGAVSSVALTGSQVTASAGTLTPTASLALTGDASTVSAGTIGIGQALTGSSVTSSAGTVGPVVSVALTGERVVVAAGVITQTGGTSVTPPDTGAGRKKKRHTTDVYRVTVDGQTFEFPTLAEAIAFLDRTQALAERVAADQVAEPVQRAVSLGKAAKVDAPKVTGSAELADKVAETQAAVTRAYTLAAVELETRLLLQLSQERDDEEALLLSL